MGCCFCKKGSIPKNDKTQLSVNVIKSENAVLSNIDTPIDGSSDLKEININGNNGNNMNYDDNGYGSDGTSDHLRIETQNIMNEIVKSITLDTDLYSPNEVELAKRKQLTLTPKTRKKKLSQHKKSLKMINDNNYKIPFGKTVNMGINGYGNDMCWSIINANLFKMRGKTYPKKHHQVMSNNAMYDVIGVDMFLISESNDIDLDDHTYIKMFDFKEYLNDDMKYQFNGYQIPNLIVISLMLPFYKSKKKKSKKKNKKSKNDDPNNDESKYNDTTINGIRILFYAKISDDTVNIIQNNERNSLVYYKIYYILFLI